MSDTKESGVYDDFESGELYLSIAKSEYDNEHKRTEILDTKISIALGVITAYFLIIPQIIELKNTLRIPVNSVIEALKPICQITVIVAALIFALFSLIWLLRGLMTNPYKVIDVASFSDPENISVKKGIYAAGVARYYVEATWHNLNINNKRVKIYDKGVVFALISVSLFVIYIFLRG